MVVTAPDGTEWEVARRWYRRPRWRRLDLQLGDLTCVDSSPDGIVASIVLTVVAIVGFAIVILVLLPAILFLLEIPVVLALVLIFRRRYVIEARSLTTGQMRSWTVRGWRRSRLVQRQVAEQLARGAGELGPA
jgi:hypothetical protein